MSEQPNAMTGELIEVPDTSGQGLAQIVRDEIDIQIATAKKYPRSVTLALKQAETLACFSQQIAQTAYYRLPRKSQGEVKFIEGPSIRLAEMFASSWGNIRYGSRVIEIGDRFVIAQGFAHDLQTNSARSAEVSRRITDRNNRRYSDDMIQVTAMAACSIAVRNALFSVIPRAYVLDVMDKAKRVAIGDAKSLKERRQTLLEYITGKMGVLIEQVLAAVNRPRPEDIDLNDLEHLYGLANAVKDGVVKLDEAFPPIKPEGTGDNKPEQPTSRTDALAAKIAAAPDKTPEVKTPEPAPAAPEPAPAIEPIGDESEVDQQAPTPQNGSNAVPDDPDMSSDEFIRLILAHKPADMTEEQAMPLIKPRLNIWLPKAWSRLTLAARKDYIAKVKAGYFPWSM
jgi:hypothetical protein